MPTRSNVTIWAARGGTPPAFRRRCIPPPPQRGCRVGDPVPGGVAPPSNIPDILGRRALPGVPSVAATLGAPAGRIAALGATAVFHHGLLARLMTVVSASTRSV